MTFNKNDVKKAVKDDTKHAVADTGVEAAKRLTQHAMEGWLSPINRTVWFATQTPINNTTHDMTFDYWMSLIGEVREGLYG